MNPHSGLDWLVQCQWKEKSHFETIAAFNDRDVALAYANECRKANPFLTYRVWKAES